MVSQLHNYHSTTAYNYRMILMASRERFLLQTVLVQCMQFHFAHKTTDWHHSHCSNFTIFQFNYLFVIQFSMNIIWFIISLHYSKLAKHYAICNKHCQLQLNFTVKMLIVSYGCIALPSMSTFLIIAEATHICSGFPWMSGLLWLLSSVHFKCPMAGKLSHRRS